MLNIDFMALIPQTIYKLEIVIWSRKTGQDSKKFAVMYYFLLQQGKVLYVIPQQSSPVYIFFYGEQTEIFDSLIKWFLKNIVIILC